MRLIKNNAQVKSVKNKINKNKSIIDELSNMKYKIETPFFQDKNKKNNIITKEKLKEKAFKDSQVSKKVQSNTNIYKPNKNIQNKSTTQIKKNSDKKSIYSKNKTISLNTNNNINIGNNINIITNNHILENNKGNKEDNLPNNNLITNNSNQGLNTEFYINKKSAINEFYNNNNDNDNVMNNESRINRIREAMGYKARRFRGKNTSMEHRNHKFGRELLMSDGDLMTDEENIDMRRNYGLFRPYKFNYPTEFYNNNLRQQRFKSSNENNLFTNNINNINNNYFYNKAYDNMDEGDIFYNKFYQKSNDEFVNKNRNKYNTIISYKNPANKFNFNNDFQNQTTNGFYIHKTPMNVSKVNKTLITNKDASDDDSIYTSYLNYLKNNRDINRNHRIRRNHSVIEENNLALSPHKNYINTNYNNNYLDNINIIKSNRRSKNRIKIIKKNNSTSIQEYNLSVAGDEDDTNELDEYGNKFLLTNNIKNGRISLNLNDNNINKKTIFNDNIGLQKYYDNFKKNIQPITNTQFNINSTISQINVTNDNFNNFTSTNKKNSYFAINENTISNSKSTNNLGFTPNFSDTGKTPKRPNNIISAKIRAFNEEEINEINTNSFNNSFISKNNNDDKLTSKKKQKEEERIQSSEVKRKNSFSSSINRNLSKIVNNNFEIFHNDTVHYFGIEKENEKEKNLNTSNKKKSGNDDKFVFDNENDIIDYIYNKFEEERKKKNYFNRKLRFTGFVLSKKYKGKNLYDVRIEDNIDKINQQLKDEQILISNKPVEFRFTEDEKDKNENDNNNVNEDIEKMSNELDKLSEENKRLKAENDKLNKKDSVKNGLIKKLDNEKQNFLEEINKLKEEIEQLKDSNKNKEKKEALYEIDDNNFLNIENNKNNNSKKIEEDSEENSPNILYNFKVTFNKIQKGKIIKSNKGINDKKKEKEKSEINK